MNSNLLELLLGLSVQIRRSDGRVHAATVKSVDEDKSTAMVEWNQKDILQMKEIEISELCSLNPEIFAHLKEIKTKAAEPPPPKKYETRSRLSRIPAPSSSAAAASGDSVSTRSQARQTCLFQSLNSVKESPPPQRRRNHVNSAMARSGVCQSMKENEEPDRIAPLAKGRKSVLSSELVKGQTNKRMSSVMRPPDAHTKKGKFLEVSRPNQKFYEMIQEFRETLEIKSLSASDQVQHKRICVCVRKRPLNSQELKKKEIDVVSVTGSGELLVHEPKQKVDLTKYLDHQTFNFDHTFDENTTNDLVYRFTAKPLVASIFEGGMATCFAYGQTGSGKTHTMGGNFSGRQQNSSSGIYALAAQDVFTYLSSRRFSSLNVSVYVSFFEIYNGKVYDLLNKKRQLRVLEDERQQVQVVGLEEVCISTAEEVIDMVQIGSACRTSGQTSANANSSRSHAVLQIALRRNDRACSLHGKFSLVDLAGNERGTDVSSNDRITMVETAEINRSLLALKECIRSLGKNSDHIPFRMSTLTKVLRDSFIGEKSKTCMIAMVAPGMSSCEYTMNTLRYADRVKGLKGKSKDKDAVKAAEFLDEKSSSEEEEEESVEDQSFYDPLLSAELEEKVYNQLKKAADYVKDMEGMFHLSKNFSSSLVEYSRSLLEMTEALLDSQNADKN